MSLQIEYVEDPKTFERVPTCHRTRFESIKTDVDYEAGKTGFRQSMLAAIKQLLSSR